MRIAMISQWYDPEGSSAALPGVISRALSAQGHDVHVVTGYPNYPEGKVLPGYRMRPYRREEMRGVTVHRAPLYASHDGRAGRRAATYASFAGAASAVAVARLPQVDATLVHGTPATAAIPAMALRAVRRTPFVLHVQDLWPQTVTHSGFLADGHSTHVERALHRYCDLVYRHASLVAVISPGMAAHIADRGVPDEKIRFVPNWADEQAFRPRPPDPRYAAALGLGRRFTVMYAGIFGRYQNLHVLLAAAARLRERADIGFALVGGGVEGVSLRTRVAQEGLDNVTFIPLQPFDRMAQVLALGDAHLVSLQDLPLFRSTLPSKLQATMAPGRPVIGALAGDAAEVVERSGGGIIVTPGSVEEMTAAIVRLADVRQRRVLIVGARGFIGRAVVEVLTALGHDVSTLRGPRLTPMPASAAASFIAASPLVDDLRERFWAVDTVVNTAGNPDASETDGDALVSPNGILPGLLAAACRAAGRPGPPLGSCTSAAPSSRAALLCSTTPVRPRPTRPTRAPRSWARPSSWSTAAVSPSSTARPACTPSTAASPG